MSALPVLLGHTARFRRAPWVWVPDQQLVRPPGCGQPAGLGPDSAVCVHSMGMLPRSQDRGESIPPPRGQARGHSTFVPHVHRPGNSLGWTLVPNTKPQRPL